MNDMLELIKARSTLGDNAIYAFIFSQILEFVALMIVIALPTWGIRVMWKTWKDNNFEC